WGATHVLELTAADLTLTNKDNTAMIFTNTVTAPFSMKFAGYVLDQAFDSSTTNPGAYGITFSLGPSTAATKWMSAVQIASDATPTIYGSFGTDYSVSAVGSTAVVTRCNIVDTNGVTFNVVSNVTVASTVTPTTTSPILNAQTGDVAILAPVTPTPTNALSSLYSGRIRCYFRIIGKNYK
ncbi:MAG: hypothetical protein WCG06_06745, partial [Candidatus Omnitrophota bacterium]